MTATELWWITLGAGLLVAVGVGALLALILRTVRRIADMLGDIWIGGQSVANNTLHIDLLRRSAVVAEEILTRLEHSSQHARRVRPRR